MSVLVKGMKMPKCCRDCPLFMNVWFGEIGCRAIDYSMYFDDGEVFKPWKQRYKGCPLVPVPPHGDLIDRRYAIATACSGRIRALPTTEDGEDWIRVEEVRESIKNAPTIIPASGGEEDE